MSPLISVLYYFYIAKDDKYQMARAIRLWKLHPGTQLYVLRGFFCLLPFIFMISQSLFSHLREMQGELGERRSRLSWKSLIPPQWEPVNSYG